MLLGKRAETIHISSQIPTRVATWSSTRTDIASCATPAALDRWANPTVSTERRPPIGTGICRGTPTAISTTLSGLSFNPLGSTWYLSLDFGRRLFPSGTSVGERRSSLGFRSYRWVGEGRWQSSLKAVRHLRVPRGHYRRIRGSLCGRVLLKLMLGVV